MSALIDVDTTTHRVTRTLRGFTARLAWCALHGEPVWLFDDGSSQCPHDLVVETNSVHQIVDGPWETEESTGDGQHPRPATARPGSHP